MTTAAAFWAASRASGRRSTLRLSKEGRVWSLDLGPWILHKQDRPDRSLLPEGLMPATLSRTSRLTQPHSVLSILHQGLSGHYGGKDPGVLLSCLAGMLITEVASCTCFLSLWDNGYRYRQCISYWHLLHLCGIFISKHFTTRLSFRRTSCCRALIEIRVKIDPKNNLKKSK